MQKLIFFLLAFSLSSLAEQTPDKSPREITPNEAKSLLATPVKPIVLDVRTKKEFQEGHINGAINIDYKGEAFRAELLKLDKNKTYLVHCKSGGRSKKALKLLQDLGFTHLIHMEAGMDGFSKL